jgi:hypothetical protein
MFQNAFAGHAKRPSERELAAALGSTQSLWQSLIASLKRELKLDAEEWNSSSVKAGWALRLQLKKRNIVYLSPAAGYFLASFALGEKAVTAARKSELPPAVVKTIDSAKRYAEGTAVRIEVRGGEDLDAVKVLARVKVEN